MVLPWASPDSNRSMAFAHPDLSEVCGSMSWDSIDWGDVSPSTDQYVRGTTHFDHESRLSSPTSDNDRPAEKSERGIVPQSGDSVSGDQYAATSAGSVPFETVQFISQTPRKERAIRKRKLLAKVNPDIRLNTEAPDKSRAKTSKKARPGSKGGSKAAGGVYATPDSHKSPEGPEAAAAEHPPSAETGAAAARRRSHNTVEKRYRNRLNWQFEQLLQLLPYEATPEQEHSAGETAGGHSRVSKAMVLDMARRRILDLEEQQELMKMERDGLMARLDGL